MTFTEPEQQFLSAQRRGRLATVAPGGSPQVKPVGFTVNAELGTIDIAGFNMSGSAKFRNILANPKVAFVVDEVIFEGIDGVRFLEIRGVAEAAVAPVPADSYVAPDLIRIRPRRILAFNIDPERPGLQARDVERPSAQLPGAQPPGAQRRMSAMRVIEVARFGGPEVLTAASAPDPVAGPGEVVIDVAAADVLFLDTLIRSGRAARFFPVRPPYVPGNGVAGVVSSIGDGVASGLLGQRVIAHTGLAGGSGGYTERAAVPADRVVQVPDGVDLRDAAAVLHDGVTALAITERMGLDAGDQVLILGAAGGMGIILVQLARAAGARVIAAARGAAKLRILADLSADEVVDYSEPGWAGRVVKAAGGTGPRVVLDGAGGQRGREAFEITAPGGRFSAHGSAGGGFAPIDPEEARRRDISVLGLDQVRFSDDVRVRLARRVLAELAAGRIRPYIGQTFPLEKAADAHAAIEARAAVGKTLLALQ